jgi:hypothetical protein
LLALKLPKLLDVGFFALYNLYCTFQENRH